MWQQYLKNKKILITGITGFVGSHLASKLTELGADVYGLSRKKSQTKNIYCIDILDYSKLKSIFTSLDIDICFHLAGESLVEIGQTHPYETFKINIEGTLNILEICRIQKIEKIIVASTAHVYGRNSLPYYEGYAPQPSRPYETSKTCTDLIAQSYAKTFNLPVLIPRFVNIYGPGDMNFSRLIPKTIKTVLLNKSPSMWGNGNILRDYLYIDDAIKAYLKLLTVNFEKIDNNRIFNFGSDNRISVRKLIEKIIFLSQEKMTVIKVPEQRAEEIASLYVSWNKARKVLQWKPVVDLHAGLRKTIAWYKKFFIK